MNQELPNLRRSPYTRLGTSNSECQTSLKDVSNVTTRSARRLKPVDSVKFVGFEEVEVKNEHGVKCQVFSPVHKTVKVFGRPGTIPCDVPEEEWNRQQPWSKFCGDKAEGEDDIPELPMIGKVIQPPNLATNATSMSIQFKGGRAAMVLFVSGVALVSVTINNGGGPGGSQYEVAWTSHPKNADALKGSVGSGLSRPGHDDVGIISSIKRDWTRHSAKLEASSQPRFRSKAQPFIYDVFMCTYYAQLYDLPKYAIIGPDHRVNGSGANERSRWYLLQHCPGSSGSSELSELVTEGSTVQTVKWQPTKLICAVPQHPDSPWHGLTLLCLVSVIEAYAMEIEIKNTRLGVCQQLLDRASNICAGAGGRGLRLNATLAATRLGRNNHLNDGSMQTVAPVPPSRWPREGPSEAMVSELNCVIQLQLVILQRQQRRLIIFQHALSEYKEMFHLDARIGSPIRREASKSLDVVFQQFERVLLASSSL
ncbi:hypothetical protein FA15DRAFT_658334 [Coprinopsis marcescibilis]|uniref:Uncharacterized protein n=1 Tax=Coprinopsis marcescibilis TaxID=230819 RepID=A0A5C3KMG6_COPMA|nr:hypothetical protein FA15DRAFT_658334 [Coprinopsis marcescibilis]